MRVLVGAMSNLRAFAVHPPVPGAELVEWIEPQSGRVRLAPEGGAATQLPDRSVHCTAWALEVESMEDFVEMLDDWRTDHAASVEVSVRERGRRLDAQKDLVVALMDYDGNEIFYPCVVSTREAQPD